MADLVKTGGLFSCSFRHFKAGSALAAFLWACLTTLPGFAIAETTDCARLQRQIAEAGSGNPGLSARYSQAAAKIHNEINSNYQRSQSLGCNSASILPFSRSRPTECVGLDSINQALQDRLNGLVQETDRRAAESQNSLRVLLARQQTHCTGGQTAILARPPARNILEALFMPGVDSSRMVQIPLTDQSPSRSRPRSGDLDAGLSLPRGTKAVCVRTCDGGFFPIDTRKAPGGLVSLNDVCKALCPNAEAALYTYPAGRDVSSAVSENGIPYTQLPNAFRFQKVRDPSCGCKAQGQSWAQALTDAERLMGEDRKGEMTVTPEKAEELSRPVLQADGKPMPPVPATSPANIRQGLILTLGGNDTTSDIPAPSAVKPSLSPQAKVYTTSDGVQQDMTGPDGVKRKVRIISTRPEAPRL